MTANIVMNPDFLDRGFKLTKTIYSEIIFNLKTKLPIMKPWENDQDHRSEESRDSHSETGEKSGFLSRMRQKLRELWQDERGEMVIGQNEKGQASGSFLRGLPRTWRNDRETVLAEVNKDGWNLRFVSKKLRDDKEVVLAAVANHGLALQWASKRLRDDEEVVLTAVKNNGEALQYASDRLRCCYEIVLAAVTQNGRALRFIENVDLLQQHPELHVIAEKTFKYRKGERQ